MAIESKSQLGSKITVDEFETTHRSPSWSLTEQLYQSSLKSWEQFKLKIAPGDELWSYSHGMGNIGIALVRNGEIVGDFVIMER